MELKLVNGISYKVMRPEQRQAVLEVVAKSFIQEPSSLACSLGAPSPEDWTRFTEFFMDECSTNGLSVVAMDGERIVGAFINRDFLGPLPEGLMEFIESSPFAPVIGAILELDDRWFEAHPEIPKDQKGRVVDLWMVGVCPQYRGHQIANHLTELSLEVVAQAGFDMAVVEATGAFSQAAMIKAGCRPVYELAYKDFLWNGKAVFAEVPPPHSKWVIMEKNLRHP